jgi:hypothetical protein
MSKEIHSDKLATKEKIVNCVLLGGGCITNLPQVDPETGLYRVAAWDGKLDWYADLTAEEWRETDSIITGYLLLERVKREHPGFIFEIEQDIDEHFVWEGEANDPRLDGDGQFYDILVYAKAIVDGEFVTGEAVLGSTYMDYGQPLGDVNGYLEQLLKDAVEDLMANLERKGVQVFLGHTVYAEWPSYDQFRAARDRFYESPIEPYTGLLWAPPGKSSLSMRSTTPMAWEQAEALARTIKSAHPPSHLQISTHATTVSKEIIINGKG